MIVANKWWEADPLVAALSSAQTAPVSVRFVSESATPGLRGCVLGARGVIEVWCLQELLPARVSASSTEEKAKVLPGLLNAPDVAVVVAFGTASTTSEDDNRNGSVVIGTNAFVHDPKSKNTQSHWMPPDPDVVMPSKLPNAVSTVSSARTVSSNRFNSVCFLCRTIPESRWRSWLTTISLLYPT